MLQMREVNPDSDDEKESAEDGLRTLNKFREKMFPFGILIPGRPV